MGSGVRPDPARRSQILDKAGAGRLRGSRLPLRTGGLASEGRGTSEHVEAPVATSKTALAIGSELCANKGMRQAHPTDEDLRTYLALNIRALRRAMSLTSKDAAKRAKIPLRNLQKIEDGEVNVYLSTLARLADTLDVDVAALVRKPLNEAPEEGPRPRRGKSAPRGEVSRSAGRANRGHVAEGGARKRSTPGHRGAAG